MTPAGTPAPAVKYWSRSTGVLLLLVGLVLSLASFAVVIGTGSVPWHGARDAELTATYDTYLETGVFLIKPTGSGSYGAQAPVPGPLSAATWDDDPGSYILASLAGHITGSSSPYPGLTLFQALLVALPLLWLPTAVARIFKRARAGYALILLPPLLWVINHGAVLVGTEYGLSDATSPMRVYAIYGIAASLAFLSLSLVLLLSTFRLKWSTLIALSLLLGVLAGFGNLARAYSGMGVAVCVGVLWWLNSSQRWRLVVGALASIAAIALTVAVQTGVMGVINTARAEATGQTSQELPDAHALWHSMYMGLSYPTPITGGPSRFGVAWSDEYGWEVAREVDPDVVIQSAEYDSILKDLYLQKVSADPWGAVKLYVQKTLYVVGHFSGMLVFIVAGFALALLRKGPHRKLLVVGLVISVPTLALGLAPPVLVMPLLYYFSELSAALGLLAVIALGAMVWSLSSFPAQILGAERRRLLGRDLPDSESTRSAPPVSVIVVGSPDGNATDNELDALRAELSPDDELTIVGDELVGEETQPRLGEALRTAVLASRGQRVLLIADSAYATEPDTWDITRLNHEGLAVGSLAESDSASRGIRRRLVRFFREAFLPLGTPSSPVVVWASGDWVRSFARLSRETGALWTTELVVAAGRQGIDVHTVTFQAHGDSEADAAAAKSSGLWHSLTGLAKVAFHKDEYALDLTKGSSAS